MRLALALALGMVACDADVSGNGPPPDPPATPGNPDGVPGNVSTSTTTTTNDTAGAPDMAQAPTDSGAVDGGVADSGNPADGGTDGGACGDDSQPCCGTEHLCNDTPAYGLVCLHNATAAAQLQYVCTPAVACGGLDQLCCTVGGKAMSDSTSNAAWCSIGYACKGGHCK